jgi:hypothetical protein
MGIYELVPYWEPQYVKCQSEALQQAQPQAEATLPSAATLADNVVFQSFTQVSELTFSVQACIPYISVALMAILLGLCVLLKKGCVIRNGWRIWERRNAGYLNQCRFLCFFR